jgi:hypothetical protein
MRFALWAFALSLTLLHATTLFAAPVAVTPAAAARVSPSFGSAGGLFGGNYESYTPSRPRGFFEAGIGLPSSTGIWLSQGWTLSAGAELPVASSWSLVPRVHGTGASTEAEGTLNWFRFALDGRLSQRRGRMISYQEAGIGIGILDAPVVSTLPDGSRHLEQRSSGSPSFQLVGGASSDPELGPAFHIEFVWATGLGVERPGSLELLVGLGF